MKKFFLVALSALLAVPALAVEIPTIADAKKAPRYTQVTLSGKVLTTSYNDILAYRVYIEEPDRSAGIMLSNSSSTAFQAAVEGKTVNVTGTVDLSPWGECFINNAAVTITGSRSPLKPLAMDGRTVGGSLFGLQKGVANGQGLSNVGLLVRTWGKVTAVDTTNWYYTIADGSGRLIQADLSRLDLNSRPPKLDTVVLTGVLSTKPGATLSHDPTPLIKVRRKSDVQVMYPDLEYRISQPVPAGKVAVHWLGQGGFLLKDSEGRKVAVDPYLSDYCYYYPPDGKPSNWVRMIPVPISPDRLKPDLTLLTHDHIDHTDPWSLRPIYQSSQSIFWGPTASYDHLGKADIGVPANRRAVLNRGQSLSWNGIHVQAVYAKHDANPYYVGVGFVITMAGKNIYISGDTQFDSTLTADVSTARPDIAIVCVNGQWGNMGASQAASVVKASGAQTAIPMHYGTYSIQTGNVYFDPQIFANECRTQGAVASVVILPAFGSVVL